MFKRVEADEESIKKAIQEAEREDNQPSSSEPIKIAKDWLGQVQQAEAAKKVIASKMRKKRFEAQERKIALSQDITKKISEETDTLLHREQMKDFLKDTIINTSEFRKIKALLILNAEVNISRAKDMANQIIRQYEQEMKSPDAKDADIVEQLFNKIKQDSPSEIANLPDDEIIPLSTKEIRQSILKAQPEEEAKPKDLLNPPVAKDAIKNEFRRIEPYLPAKPSKGTVLHNGVFGDITFSIPTLRDTGNLEFYVNTPNAVTVAEGYKAGDWAELKEPPDANTMGLTKGLLVLLFLNTPPPADFDSLDAETYLWLSNLANYRPQRNTNKIKNILKKVHASDLSQYGYGKKRNYVKIEKPTVQKGIDINNNGKFGKLLADLYDFRNDILTLRDGNHKIVFKQPLTKGLKHLMGGSRVTEQRRKEITPEDQLSYQKILQLANVKVPQGQPSLRSFANTPVLLYKTPEQLVDRLDDLIASQNAGNRGKLIRNTITEIIDELLRIHYISPEEHEKLFMLYARPKL